MGVQVAHVLGLQARLWGGQSEGDVGCFPAQVHRCQVLSPDSTERKEQGAPASQALG